MGFVIDFLSKATLVGFMAGAAIIVSLQQLKGLLGIVHFTNKMGIVPVLTSVFERTDEVRNYLICILISKNEDLQFNFRCFPVNNEYSSVILIL